MWEARRCLVCWGMRIASLLRAHMVRGKTFSEWLKVIMAKECDLVLPYGVMVRLGGDQEK